MGCTGIPCDMLAVIFTLTRSVGWISQRMEMMAE
ncbi:MAG: hypothetical protein GY807_17805 [Gammaproteobacteria bacterium]|nr:hypothetical protein [Gammaproteobacteria bacterium]